MHARMTLSAGLRRSSLAVGIAAISCSLFVGACVVGALANEAKDAPTSGRPDTVEARRARIEQMSAAEKDGLARALERFEQLDRDEQQRLRELRRRIEASPKAAELEQIVAGYYDWLASLTAGKRAEIQALPPEKRVAVVKRELNEESSRNQDRLSLQDYLVLADWLHEEFEAQVLEHVPHDKRGQYDERPAAVRRATVVYMLARRMRDDGPRPLDMLGAESIDKLASRLSSTSREQLERADSLEAKRRIVGRWVYDFVQRSMGRRQLGSLLADISEKDLTEFFEKEVSDEERERLLSLSPEEMWHDLRMEYVRKQMPDLFEGRSFRGRGDYRGGPPAGRPDGRPDGRPGPRPEGFERRPPFPGAPAPPER